MTELPDESNLHGTIESPIRKGNVAKLFSASGWNVRKSSWVDFELTSPFAELTLEGDEPLLLHGAVRDVEENARTIASILRGGGLAFSLECYGPDGSLLNEITEHSNRT